MKEEIVMSNQEMSQVKLLEKVAFLKTNHQAIMQPIEQKTEANIVKLFGSVDPQEKSADPTVATREARKLKYG